MVEKCNLPKDFQWVDLDNYDFNRVLDEVLNGDGNLFIQAKAGCGKSLIIKILSALRDNLVVLSTTGTTAIQLSSDGIPARTIHSFFQFKPSSIVDSGDIKKWYGQAIPIVKTTEILVIDEVSMLNAQMFDSIIIKLKTHRGGNLPRLILFGDVLQLPPVIETGIISQFFEKHYGGNVMFFNSSSFKFLDFKVMTLNQSYRQVDEEFADNIYSIGLGSIDKHVLEYFNSRIMSLPKFEETHNNCYMYMATTNAIVNKINKAYINDLYSDKWITYKSIKSEKFPPNLIEDEIMIKKGAQVMVTKNNYSEGYTNGLVGTCIDLDDNFVTVEAENGKIFKVGRSTYEISKPYIDEKTGKIKFKVESWANQIDCKICRAMTIHKSQGKTFDNAYLAPVGWTPPGVIYVGLSRLTTLNGLGISRPLTMDDIKVNKEAMDFLLNYTN